MLLALASAKGSPGVTATAVALAALWPREVLLADLDAAGGDAALRYRTPEGDPLDTDVGLLSLGAGVRRGSEVDLEPHLQEVGGGLDVLAGVAAPDQVMGLGPVWGTIAGALRAGRRDVVADCGRVLPGGALIPVLAGADALVVVVRPDLSGVAHLRERLRSLVEPLGLDRPDGTPTGVVVRTGERDRRTGPDLAQLLSSAGLDVPVLGVVAEDPRGVAALEQQRGGSGRSSFVRSVRSLVPAVVALAERRAGPGG